MEITGNNLQQLRCCDPETGSENHPGRGSTFFQEKHACADNTVPERVIEMFYIAPVSIITVAAL